jgi:hypothetical protein
MAPSKGISLINQAISERRAVITRLGTLSVTAVRGGPQLLAEFKQVLRQSIHADPDFIGWIAERQELGDLPGEPNVGCLLPGGPAGLPPGQQREAQFPGSVEPVGHPVRPAKI